MQPSNASPQYPPPSGYAGSTHDQRPGFGTPPPEASITRVRPWAVALTGAIVVAILLAAIGNQKVTDAILRRQNDDQSSFWDNALRSLTSFAWRFSPRGGHDFGRIWIAGVVFVLVTIVLTFLFTYVLARGKRGFGGAFFATWAAALFATVVASYIRATVVDLRQLTNQDLSKPVSVFFAQYAPGAYSTFAALLLGFVAALIAGLVGALANTTNYFIEPSAAPYPPAGPVDDAPPEARQPDRQMWSAPPPPEPAPAPWTSGASRTDLSKHDEPGHTAVLPVVQDSRSDDARADSQATTQFPAYGEQRPDEPTTSRSPEPEATQAYRVPTDDGNASDATQAYRLPADGETTDEQRRREP